MSPEERISLSRGDDGFERKMINDVREFGVHILHIFDPDHEAPRFSYTVGLWHTYSHPEMLIFGLKDELCHSVLNDLNRRIASGKTFLPGSSATGLLEGFRVYFELIPPSIFKEFLGWDRWFYDGDSFEAVQLIWPNTSGVFPWETTASEELRRLEPIYSRRPLLVS